MKIKGKVLEYDKFSGKIVGENGKTYIVIKIDIVGEIKQGDLVIFESDKYNIDNQQAEIARFVKKIKYRE